MDKLNVRAKQITADLIKICSKVEFDEKVVNLNNAIQILEARIELRFEEIEDEQEAIELVKIWINSEKSVQENWDVAFLLSRYRVEDTSIMQELAYKYLGLDTSDKNLLYEIFGLIPIRYADYEVRRRLLRYYRKAYTTRTFFKKDSQTIKVDNVQEEVTKTEYLLLLRQDLQHLEDKFRVPLAHQVDEKEIDKVWEGYLNYLSITYYVLLMTETEERLLIILENLSGIPYNSLGMEEFGKQLKEFNHELYQKYSVTAYHLYLFYVIQLLSKFDSNKNYYILSAINQANQWMEEYELIENKLSHLSNKQAKELDCLTIFFPEKVANFLKLKEVDSKRYELTVLFKAALSKSSSSSTKLRRAVGVLKRNEHLKSKKESTKNAGEKIHKELLKGNSIKGIADKLGIKRETVYKRLYAYYYKIYAKEEKKVENIHLNQDEIQKLLCETHQIRMNHLTGAIKRFGKSN
ncbi:DNA-binding CsgD family transcriptional regulator [Enterococcus rotai]|uniref:Uncharacterized protein n=1 Tax=Enterococcus rotai TaxID=118060 RepID=A0A0U2VVY5_9ENTE|nr:hypothetical protein [Enterococcus rotai]ALS38479.1 hypothetical protein ATZ35_15395 [Enterococcus rotai]